MPRPRLLAHLDPAPPLTIVRAPLGFGKTTFLAQHLRERRCGSEAVTAWLRLWPDTADRDAFWAAVLECLRGLPGIATSPPHGEQSTRARVRHVLFRASGPITLVLDEFDHVTADRVDHELLMILRDSPQLNLVVALRGHRHFPPALYLDIDHTTIDADDLRFTVEETETLLRLCGVDSPQRRAANVHAETGGWPELTRACTLALQSRSDRISRTVSRDDTETATTAAAVCLDSRVLPAIGEADMVQFALAASVLDEIPVQLATLLAPDPEIAAGTRLAHLAADGVLTIDPGDGDSTVYRWPPAAQRALYREAMRRDPEHVRSLHQAASEWFLTHDQPEHALRHATRSQDWPMAVRVIEACWEDLFLTAQKTLIAAFSALPDDVTESSLLCRIVRSLILAGSERSLLESLPTLPEDPGQLTRLAHEPDAYDHMRLADAVMVTLRVRGHHALASEHGERLSVLAETVAVTHSANVTRRLPGLLLQIGITHLYAGVFTPAHRALRRAYDLAPHASTPHVARDAAGKLALLLTLQGHTDRAALWLDRFDAAPRSQGWLEDQVTSTGLLARAWAALEVFDLPAAARTLGEIDTDVIGGHEAPMMIACLEALHRLHTGRADEALHELSRVISNRRPILEPTSLPATLTAAVKADLLLARGRGNHARAIIQGTPDHPLMRTPHARMLLLAGDPAGAIGIANDFEWLQSTPPRLLVEMLVIKAVAHHRNGQPSTATATLGNAISAAAGNRLRRAFATFPHDELLAIAEGLPPQSRAFLDHPALAAATAAFPTRVDLIHLTQRERLILTRLAGDQRVHDIAAELFLSYNTVRSYLRTIYQKLSANSREQAVAHARAYGLIAS